MKVGIEKAGLTVKEDKLKRNWLGVELFGKAVIIKPLPSSFKQSSFKQPYRPDRRNIPAQADGRCGQVCISHINAGIGLLLGINVPKATGPGHLKHK